MADGKILIAYGTRYGSARIVAEDIKKFVERSGYLSTLVDLRKESVPGSLRDYRFIVAGSSIAMFSWIPKVKAFLRKCARAGVPTGVYITCGTAIETPQKARDRFLDKILSRVGLRPVLSMVIGPVIDFRPQVGLPAKLKARISGTVKAMAKDRYQEDGLMDLRDEAVFQAFLDDLLSRLGSGDSTAS